MDIRVSQPSLPFHDVAKTQALRERLEKSVEAKQDLVDILTLGSEKAEARIDSREEALIEKRLNVDSEKKWTGRLFTASALSLGGAVVAGVTGNGGVAVALGMGSLLTFAGGGAFAAGAHDQRGMAWLARGIQDKEQLLSEVQQDPLLTPHLAKKTEWLAQNKAEDVAAPVVAEPNDSVLGRLSGGVNVALRAPQIVTAPLVNALGSPRNLAEEAENESTALSSVYVGSAALAGAGVGMAIMLSQPDISGLAQGIFTVIAGGLGAAVGGMTGMMAAQGVSGLATPLNVGRKTQQKLGEGEHSILKQYTTGVALATEAAYKLGRDS